MNAKRYLIVCRRPPYGESYAREALDVALAAAAFEQPVAFLFLGDGVTQLLRAQDSTAIGEKSLEKQLSALPLYDVDELYIDAVALQQRGLTIADLSLPVHALELQDISALLRRSDIILNF